MRYREERADKSRGQRDQESWCLGEGNIESIFEQHRYRVLDSFDIELGSLISI